MKSHDYLPGVPAAGHVTARGYWHSGAAGNCSKPGCAAEAPSRPIPTQRGKS